MPGFYSIPLAGLKEARYSYKFTIGDDFFAAFEESEIKRGEFEAVVELIKGSAQIELEISISGRAEVVCDRCLDPFFMPLSSVNRLFIRLGKEWDDSDPDMITLPVDEHEIDLGQFFYEYIHLALPIQRIHPDDADGRVTCNPDMIRKLNAHRVHGDAAGDPRWEELKRLTGNN